MTTSAHKPQRLCVKTVCHLRVCLCDGGKVCLHDKSSTMRVVHQWKRSSSRDVELWICLTGFLCLYLAYLSQDDLCVMMKMMKTTGLCVSLMLRRAERPSPRAGLCSSAGIKQIWTFSSCCAFLSYNIKPNSLHLLSKFMLHVLLWMITQCMHYGVVHKVILMQINI